MAVDSDGDIMTVSITETNTNFFKKLIESYRGKKYLAVGFPVGTTGAAFKYPKTGASIVMVALKNNYGDGNIPARDFMGPGGVRALKKTEPMVAQLMDLVNTGKMTTTQLLETIGPTAVEEFKQTIIDIKEPPNSEETIARKNSSNPLVDEGHLVNTLTYQVRT